MAYLELTHITKVFDSGIAVADFNLAVERGEFISFLGPSGCGKTTTLRMVAGFETPTSGTITVDGQDITYTPANQRNVGMVFQSYALFPNMTVADNIGFGLKLRKRPKAEIAQRVDQLLNLIHLADRGNSYPGRLSGGQQQRVALARALAIEPQVLLLDEPLSALDARIRDELRVELRRIQRELGITTIYVTHDQEEAMALSDRVVVMNRGVIEQVGSPFEIYNYPQTLFVASFVGTLNKLPCIVSDAERGHVDHNGHTIVTGAPLPKANGTPITLMLRPEELRLGANGGENQMLGLIDSVNFLGSTARVILNLNGTSLTLDVFNERKLELPKVGQLHTISFPAHACWVMNGSFVPPSATDRGVA
jgi:putative spermidine/putrescine transport system ATP-binding protein